MEKLKQYLIPRYDELTLYLHGISFIMLIIMNVEFRDFLMRIPGNNPKGILLEMMIATGAILSIYNAFVYRKKTEFEKKLMLIFAILSNLLVVLFTLSSWDGQNSDGITIYKLPVIINMIYTIILVIMWRFNVITESSIADDDVPLLQVITTTVPILIAFTYLEFIVKQSWAITYSWCVLVGLITKDTMRFVACEIIVPKSKMVKNSERVK